ncbi:MAG TPA: HEPN domain-containing protein [Candidatus Nanoarchaeia archaeon]|nr:HEPN domain-containing protein [Candidatus Nanoarchaeia archaeon]
MIDTNKRKEAKQNFDQYLQEGLLKKEKNEIAKQTYLKNAELSLAFAEESLNSSLKPYLWVVVISYYSMFYLANAVLLQLGYKTGSKIVHKVTSDALIVLVLDKIKKSLLEEYESTKEDALEIASIRSEELISFYVFEMEKRSQFQYNMIESIQEQKAKTSLKRAKEFILEMKKLLPEFKEIT